ncbi:MAG: hypothetical protein DMF69_16685, partial [Acidobacteria bacterium]
ALVRRRGELAKRIRAQIERVKEAHLNMTEFQSVPRFKEVLRRELKILKEFRAPQKEFAAMARQLTDEFFRSMR